MTKEEEQYYELYFDLFSHNGWKQFISEISDSVSAYRIEDINTESDLKTVKGNLQILKRIVAFEDAMRAAYDSNVETDNV